MGMGEKTKTLRKIAKFRLPPQFDGPSSRGRSRELDEACREREARAAARHAELSDPQVERIRALTRDFERVWTAPTTRTPIARGFSGSSSKTLARGELLFARCWLLVEGETET